MTNSVEMSSPLELGKSLYNAGDYGGACQWLRTAIQRAPDSAEAYFHLGQALIELRLYAEAQENLKTAIKLDPSKADFYHALGVAYTRDLRRDEALQCYNTGLSIDPKNAHIRLNRALILLAQGNWEVGWQEYEWRWLRDRRLPAGFAQTLWDGRPHLEQTILVHCEQGFGDAIQFCRFVPLVKKYFARLVLACPERLIPLLKSLAGVDEFVATGSSGSKPDLHAPLMSLPRILRITPENLPNQVPYLHANAERLRVWREQLPVDGAFKVGIVWRGNPDLRIDRERSIPLEQFEALARIDRVRLYSLLKPAGSEEISKVAERFQVVDLASRLDIEGGAFMDTAAAMKCMDLVISVDSAPVHLAGALGVPVWLPLHYVGDWRWMLGPDQAPWYPTMRLFRQAAPGDWENAMRRMVTELKALLGPVRK